MQIWTFTFGVAPSSGYRIHQTMFQALCSLLIALFQSLISAVSPYHELHIEARARLAVDAVTAIYPCLTLLSRSDHGKTTLVDAMLQQSAVFRDNEQVSFVFVVSEPI